MSIPLIALKDTYYDRPIKKGTRFAVRERREAQILKLLGRAKDAPPVFIPPPEELVTVGAEFPAEPELTIPPKRNYRRRVAEAE